VSVTVRIGERDVAILAKCAKARWLSTGQLARLFFGGVTADAVRKSLRRLTETGHLTAWRENRMSEAFHALGPKGKAVLEARGIAAEVSRTPPKPLLHMEGINDVRVAVETSGLAVAFFFAAWEVGEFGCAYDVIPDAVFALKMPARRAFAVEFDRGTETVETVFRKVRRYDEGLTGFPLAAVLVVTETAGRLQDLGRHAKGEAVRIPVFKALLGDVRSSGFGAPVFAGLFGASGGRFSVTDIGTEGSFRRP